MLCGRWPLRLQESESNHTGEREGQSTKASTNRHRSASVVRVVVVLVVVATFAQKTTCVLSIVVGLGWRRTCRLGGARRSRCVWLDGVLGTTRVFGSAGGLTCAVGAGAGLFALVAPFRALEVGHRLREFGDVGGDVVVADAAVVEGFLGAESVRRCRGSYPCAVIGNCVLCRDAGLLEANERALCLLLCAPVFWGLLAVRVR
jgi:hypothetical protein